MRAGLWALGLFLVPGLAPAADWREHTALNPAVREVHEKDFGLVENPEFRRRVKAQRKIAERKAWEKKEEWRAQATQKMRAIEAGGIDGVMSFLRAQAKKLAHLPAKAKALMAELKEDPAAPVGGASSANRAPAAEAPQKGEPQL
jgi:hypothetical protein